MESDVELEVLREKQQAYGWALIAKIAVASGRDHAEDGRVSAVPAAKTLVAEFGVAVAVEVGADFRGMVAAVVECRSDFEAPSVVRCRSCNSAKAK